MSVLCAIFSLKIGYTIEEAVANLKEATELYLEEFPLPDVSRPILTTFEATYAA